jgi:hypothetical protein
MEFQLEKGGGEGEEEKEQRMSRHEKKKKLDKELSYHASIEGKREDRTQNRGHQLSVHSRITTCNHSEEENRHSYNPTAK